MTIAASTSIAADDQQQAGDALLAEAALRPARGDRRDGDEREEAERRQHRDRVAGRRRPVAASAPCDTATSRRAAPTSSAGTTRPRTASRTRGARIATSTMTRRYMTAVASAIPAGSAPPASCRAEPLGERLGDRGRAIGAADQRGGDGAVARAENAVGDIAEKGKAGDQHHHQPQLLRVPRAVGARSGRWAGTAGPRRRSPHIGRAP